MKIATIGTGHVGSSIAFAAVLKGLCSHLVLTGRNITKAQGDALDLQHTLGFCERPMIIESSAIEDVKDCDILAITASIRTQGKVASRMELGAANVKLFRQMIPILAQNNPRSIFVVITNPVDVLTHLVTHLSGFPSSKVISVGTLVDSARFSTGKDPSRRPACLYSRRAWT